MSREKPKKKNNNNNVQKRDPKTLYEKKRTKFSLLFTLLFTSLFLSPENTREKKKEKKLCALWSTVVKGTPREEEEEE